MQILYAQHHWETAIFADDNWKYIIPSSELSSVWNTNNFNDNIWNEGPGGLDIQMMMMVPLLIQPYQSI